MSKALQEEFESTYRTCFPIAAELQPNLFSFELDDGEYVEAKVHVSFTLWLAARATAEQRDSVIEEWIEETCAAYCIPKPFAIIEAIRALKSQQDAAIESKPVEQSEPKLDKRAQVGNTRFGVGVKWSTVIGAAQRYHDYMNTPEKEGERIAKAQAFHDAMTDDASESQRSGDGS